MSSRARYRTLETIRERIHAYQDPELNTAAADLDHAAPHAYDAFRRMQDARAGLPGAQAYDSPSVSGGGRSASHPERMAEQDDRTEADRRLLDTTLTQLDGLTRPGALMLDSGAWRRDITKRCQRVRNIVDAWTPRPPSEKQRASVAAVNDGDWCAQHQTAGYMEPTHRPWLVDGVKIPLCQSCIDQHRRNDRLPTAEWMQRRASRGKADRVQA